ncbi:MAG TPA: thioredoxin family protein [Acidisarcina sp.]
MSLVFEALEAMVYAFRTDRIVTKNVARRSASVIPALILMVCFGGAACSAQQRQIYSETADAKAEVREALATAAREHKRVLLDFGGNWCGDCKALDYYFHDPSNASLLAANYVLVDINIGRFDRNEDLADKYHVPLKKGVPALTVLEADGKVVYSQRNGEFESMGQMESSAVTEFLTKWKPTR